MELDLDNALEHLTKLVRELENYLPSPTPPGKQQLQADIAEACCNDPEISPFLCWDCDESVVTLMVKMVTLEIELRSLEQQLQHLIINQNNRVEELIELNAWELVLYENH